MHSNVHIALFTIAKIWKQPEHPSTDEQIKMWYIYGILLSCKERIKSVLLVTTYISLEEIMLSEINQIEKDKYCMSSLTCRI